MSLLMDALKKAELAKREGRSDSGLSSNSRVTENVPAGLTLEPLTPPSTTAASMPVVDASQTSGPAQSTAFTAPIDPLSHLPSHLESLDDAFLAEMETTAQRTSSVSARVAPAFPKPRTQPAMTSTAAAQPTFKKEPSTAQNLFAAKQPSPAVRNKNFTLLLGGLTTLAVIAIGGYFWWQLQPHSPRPAAALSHEVRQTNPSTTSTATAAVLPAPTFSAPMSPTTSQAVTAPVLLAANATATNSHDAADDSVIAKPKSHHRAFRQQRQDAKSIMDAAVDTNDPVHLTKAPQKVDPSLLRGFDAFNRGDLASARTEYTRALQSDPRNTDALHGLAAIAQKQGHWDQAAWGYQKILEANPQDAVALAALINIRGQADPATAESRLKTLTAAQPELAAPAFSLGNLYARQGRWNEAQQAYFQAYNAEPSNPDILYNLAISLEHIRQTRLAAQYYDQAISAAKTHPASFDSAQAAARMQALQP